jgi:hypothetical protein
MIPGSVNSMLLSEPLPARESQRRVINPNRRFAMNTRLQTAIVIAALLTVS